MKALRLLALCAFLAASTPGCISFTWERDSSYQAPVELAVAALVPLESDLTECLAGLGAPLLVYEVDGGIAIAYGWSRERSLGFSFDVPLAQEFTGSVSFSTATEGLRGLLLIFDPDDRLTTIRRGDLRDITAKLRRQPAFLEDETE